MRWDRVWTPQSTAPNRPEAIRASNLQNRPLPTSPSHQFLIVKRRVDTSCGRSGVVLCINYHLVCSLCCLYPHKAAVLAQVRDLSPTCSVNIQSIVSSTYSFLCRMTLVKELVPARVYVLGKQRETMDVQGAFLRSLDARIRATVFETTGMRCMARSRLVPSWLVRTLRFCSKPLSRGRLHHID